MVSAAHGSGARIDIIAPQRFSPGLRAAIEEALRPPSRQRCSLAFSIVWGAIGLVVGYLWAG